MKPLIPITDSADSIKSAASKLFRLASLGVAGLALCQALQAAELLNGGFDSGKTNWTGSFTAGDAGGNGWSTGYFGGSYPTNNTFASSVESTIKQNLSGAGNTFVEGTTYSVSMAIFGSSNYAIGANNLWSLGFTADGTLVASDHWFSEEFTASTASATTDGVPNGGNIPDDHIITVGPGGSTGLRTVTFTYTATAADAGKVIGVQLGGHTQSKYTLAPGAPATNARYAMMDSITFTIIGAPTVSSFTSDINVIDGAPITLSWDIVDPNFLTTLTLDDGNNPINVIANTNTDTGHGELQVNPTQNTTYTLTANGGSSRSLTITNGKINSFTSSTNLATGPDYQTTLSWSVLPGSPGTVTISDGTTTTDVTADTSDGIGSRVFTVPSTTTTFTLNLNNGSATRTVSVLRSMPSDPEKFSLNLETVYAGETLTASWKNAGNASGSWVGIYKVTDLFPNQYSTTWKYISNNGGATGSVDFNLPPGQYYAVLFVDGGYTIEQGPIAFTVTGATRAPFAVTTLAREGVNCSFSWNSEAGASYDIFASDTLDSNAWVTIETNYPSAGTTTTYSEDLSQLPGGPPSKRFYRVAKSAP